MSVNSPPPSGGGYAAIDMGTNSFKLVITTATFLPLLRLSTPVRLPSPNSLSISPTAQSRAVSALRHFHDLLTSLRIPPSHTFHVATSAFRTAPNQSDFLQGFNFEVEVLSGEEEARLTYSGALQFLPVWDKCVLVVDIGGGSTEFVIGRRGEVVFGVSVPLGHVTLTQEFVGSDGVEKMRERVRSVILESGLVEELNKHVIEVVIGSSGTIRAIEKAIYNGYGKELNLINLNISEGYKRDWKFSRGDLNDLVDRLCWEEGEMGRKVERETVFEKRSEFIMAGAVLLQEIFKILKINVMEVSCYSLCEGVIAEKLAGSLGNSILNANARRRSVICLARRCNGNKKMRSATTCAFIAKEMLESVRNWNEVGDGGHRLGVSLDDKDLEYLEAACLLHSVGVITGKKGYHKQSYHIIMEGGHLRGYDLEEIKIIALLCRRHRKKFPKLDHHSLKEFSVEAKQKFRILCAIIRVSVVTQQYMPVNTEDIKVSHSQEGFKLVLSEPSDQVFIPGNAHTLPVDAVREIVKELEIFYLVIHQKLTVFVPSSSLEVSRGQASVNDMAASQL